MISTTISTPFDFSDIPEATDEEPTSTPPPSRGSITRTYTLTCFCSHSIPIPDSPTGIALSTRLPQAIAVSHSLGWRYRLETGWTCPSCNLCRCHPHADIFQPDTRPKIPNGTWTVEYGDGRSHHTVDISTQPDTASFAPGQRIISLLVAPEDYQGFGFISDDSQRITLWRKRRGTSSAPSDYDRLAYTLVRLMVRGETVFDGVTHTLHGEATCLRCNRRLTTPDSIRAGYGPECLAKVVCAR